MRQSTGIYCVALFVIFSFCSNKQFNNPIGSGYTGNYAFAVRDSLPDTLDLFTPYTIRYTIGQDSFAGLEMSPISAALVDTKLFDSTATESTFVLYFIKGTTDSVFVNAIRPNRNKLSHGIKRVVRNSYAITADTMVGIGGKIIGRCSKNFLPNTVPARLTIEWRADDAAFATTLFIESCSTTVTAQTNTHTKTLQAILMDGRGNRLALNPVTIHIPGFAPALTAFTITNATTDTILLGSKLQISLTKSDLDGTAYKAVVYLGSRSGWDTSAVKPYLTTTTTTLKAVLDTGMLSVQIFLLDTTGLKSGILAKNIFLKHTLPAVSFSDDTSHITYGDSTIFRVSSTTANHYAWRYDGLAYASTDSPYVKVFSGDSSTFHKLMCVGTDSFGYSGQPDSVLIKGRLFGYRLSPISFPTALQAKRLTTFVVALDSVARAKRNKGVCIWTVPAGYDSLVYRGILRDTLKLRYPDSASFTIKTKFTDTTALSSNELSQNCFVHTYKPVCTITIDSISVRAKSSYSLSAVATDTNTDGSIAAIEWDYKSTIISDTARTFTRTAGSVPDTFKVRARARDNDGFYSKWDTAIVAIYTSKPYFSPPANDTVIYINSTATLRVFSRVSTVGATITKRLWDFNHDGTTDTITIVDTLNRLFTIKGKDTIVVRCVDSNNDTCDAADTIIVTVSAGEPMMTGFVKPAAVFINDSLQYSATATDPNGTIARYKLKWAGATEWESSTTGSFGKKLYTAGRTAVSVFAIDNDGMLSDTLKDMVTVRLARPVCLNVTPDTAIWINDNYTYTITATDTNGTIDRYYISWDSGATYTAQSNATFSKSYSTAGLKIIKAYVKDNDSIPSDTLRDSVRVRSCVPVIDSIKIDPAGNHLFVLDSIRYWVFARDTNGYVKKIYYAWNNGTTADDSLIIARNISTIDTFITHVYDTASSGNRTIKIWLRDDDGIVSIANKDTTITVRKGLPVADSLKPDTVWCIDNNNFTISWHDTNSTVADSFKISWDGGSNWTANATGIFAKSFDTTTAKATNQTAKIMVKDADGFWGVAKDDPVTVRLGRPKVWGATFGDSIQWKTATVGYDTMFYVYGGGNTTMRLESFDTNGTISEYFWDLDANNILNATTTTTTWVQGLNANQAKLCAAWAQDDDSLHTLPITFYVFPDEPPPTPIPLNAVPNTIGDSVTLRWQGYDVKDGINGTYFQILIDYASGATPTTVLQQDYGSLFNWDGTKYLFSVRPKK